MPFVAFPPAFGSGRSLSCRVQKCLLIISSLLLCKGRLPQPESLVLYSCTPLQGFSRFIFSVLSILRCQSGKKERYLQQKSVYLQSLLYASLQRHKPQPSFF